MTVNVFEILRKRYPEAEYALMQEVSDTAGSYRSRSADFIVMNLWPSRGLHLNGIELKSFRSDWLSELKKPAKAEKIFQYCDYFWLLTSDEAIAKPEEIPATWGWMNIKGQRVYVMKEAPKLSPEPLTRGFLAALLKRACSKSGFILKSEISELIGEAEERGKRENERELKHAQDKLFELRGAIKAFEEASGISLSKLEYRRDNAPQKMGAAFRFLHDSGGTDRLREDLMALELSAKSVLEGITKGLAVCGSTKTN